MAFRVNSEGCRLDMNANRVNTTPEDRIEARPCRSSRQAGRR